MKIELIKTQVHEMRKALRHKEFPPRVTSIVEFSTRAGATRGSGYTHNTE